MEGLVMKILIFFFVIILMMFSVVIESSYIVKKKGKKNDFFCFLIEFLVSFVWLRKFVNLLEKEKRGIEYLFYIFYVFSLYVILDKIIF